MIMRFITEFTRKLELIVTPVVSLWAPENGLQHMLVCDEYYALGKAGRRGIVGEKSLCPINADFSSYFLEHSCRLTLTRHTYCLSVPMRTVQQTGLLI